MAIEQKDLESLTRLVGYGVKYKIHVKPECVIIEVGNEYEGIGPVKATLTLTLDEVKETRTAEREIMKFAQEASRRFDCALGGKVYK